MPTPPLTPFVYTPLPPGHIHLLCASRDQSPSQRLLWELAEFPTRQAPLYEALSYAWGLQDASEHIICNNARLNLTPHLLEGLQNIAQALPTQWLWVDAICINQSDDAEKAIQVKQMWQVYSAAEQVIIWMGPAPALQGTNILHIWQILKEVEDMPESDFWDIRAPSRFVRSHHQDYDLFEGLFSPYWFTRLWVVQEVLLPPRVTALYGKEPLLFTSLARLGRFLSTAGFNRPRISAGLKLCNVLNVFHLNPDKTDDLKIGLVLAMVFGQQTTEPVDRIYAILGIMSPKVREEITVDYSSESRCDYWTVYEQAFRVFIVNWGETIIRILKYTDRIRTLPSWCPNPNVEFPGDVLRRVHHGAGNQIDSPDPSTLRFSLDGSTLFLKGLEVEDIETTLPFEIGNWLTWDACAVKMLDYAAACEKLLAANTRKVWPTSLASVLVVHTSQIPNEHPRYPDQEASEDLKSCIAVCADEELESDEKTELLLSGREFRFLRSMHCACDGRAFFRTATSMGLGPKDIETGDIICVIKDFHMPYALRRLPDIESDNEPRYAILGECYVHGIMDGEILASEGFRERGWSDFAIVEGLSLPPAWRETKSVRRSAGAQAGEVTESAIHT